MTDGAGDNVISLEDRNKRRLAITGSLSFIKCAVCNDEKAGFFPVVAFSLNDPRPVVTHLLCVSAHCAGNTVFDVIGGYVTEIPRTLPPDEDDGT